MMSAITSKPLVSVIMPAYNAAATIAQAIHSVLWQGWPALEVIVVDDGSCDNTSEVLAQFGSAVRVLYQANRGPAAARNLGWQAAQGEYIAFLDADDIWLPGKLLTQMAYLNDHPQADAVFGRFERWERDDLDQFALAPSEADHRAARIAWDRGRWVRPGLLQPSGAIYTDLLLDSVVHIITAVVRRDVLQLLGGFDESLTTGEDYDFWLRASRAHRIDQLDQLVAWYRIHRDSITQRPWPDSTEYLVLQRHLRAHGPVGPDGRSVTSAVLQRRLFGICFGHGYQHYWHGHPAHARRAFARALKHQFWHPKAWVYWGLSACRGLFSPAS